LCAPGYLGLQFPLCRPTAAEKAIFGFMSLCFLCCALVVVFCCAGICKTALTLFIIDLRFFMHEQIQQWITDEVENDIESAGSEKLERKIEFLYAMLEHACYKLDSDQHFDVLRYAHEFKDARSSIDRVNRIAIQKNALAFNEGVWP
jgi:hypothetical protein